MNEKLPSFEEQIVFRPPLEVINFVDDVLPTQKSVDQRDASNYPELSKITLIPMKITISRDETLLVGIARPVKGKEITALAHFGAPKKIFGSDTGDYLSDERALFNPISQHGRDRLHSHRQIPNWSIFERIHERLTKTIKEDYENPEGSTLRLTPLIQIYKKNGISSIELSLHPTVNAYLRKSMFDTKTPALGTFMPELGPLLLAAYSPEITRTWPEDDTYSPSCGTTQRIAATQMVPYSISRANDLLAGRFASNFINYCETGQLLSKEDRVNQLLDNQTDSQTPLPFPDEPDLESGSIEPIW